MLEINVWSGVYNGATDKEDLVDRWRNGVSEVLEEYHKVVQEAIRKRFPLAPERRMMVEAKLCPQWLDDGPCAHPGVHCLVCPEMMDVTNITWE